MTPVDGAGNFDATTAFSGPDAADCDHENGKEITFYCRYESILMEHCYKCFEAPDREVIMCDRWSEPDIRAQCESASPLFSPSPDAEQTS